MRRLLRYRTAPLSFVVVASTHALRHRCALHESAFTQCNSLSDFVAALHSRFAVEAEWTLDLALLERQVASHSAESDSSFARALEILSVAAMASPLRCLSVSVPHADAVSSLPPLLRAAGPRLESLELLLAPPAQASAAALLHSTVREGLTESSALRSFRLAALDEDAVTLDPDAATELCEALALLLDATGAASCALRGCAESVGGSNGRNGVCASGSLRSLAVEWMAVASARPSGLAHLRDAAERCTDLRTLSVRGAGAVASALLPATRGTLTVLDCSATRLGDTHAAALFAASGAVGVGSQLESLYLAESGVSTQALGALHLEQLVHMDVSSNAMNNASAVALAECLAKCRSLQSLRLRHNRLGRDGVMALSTALDGMPLRELCLHSNPVGDDGMQCLVRRVPRWPELRSLDLTRCRLTTSSLMDIVALVKGAPQLETLHLDRNDFRPSNVASTAKAEGDKDLPLFAYDPAYMRRGDAKAPTSYEMEHRDAVSGRQRYTGPTSAQSEAKEWRQTLPFAQLGTALSECHSLRHLSFADCALNDTAFVALASRLRVPSLEVLDLSANPLFLHVPSLDALAELLRRTSSSLRCLDLSFTGVGDIGLTLLADGEGDLGNDTKRVESDPVLPALVQLTDLRLSHCRVGVDGFEALAGAISGNKGLRRLSLDGNNASSESLQSLLTAVASLPEMEFVGFYGSIPPNDVQAVAVSPCCTNLYRRGVQVQF